MDCKQVPAANEWDNALPALLQEYRQHIRFCPACRRRAMKEAPEQLLFELKGDPLPEDFWIGFWPSLEAQIAAGAPGSAGKSLRLLRWAAVFMLGLILAVSGSSTGRLKPALHTPVLPTPAPAAALQGPEFPLVEEVQNPHAVYYIFEPASGEKVVMVFDPDMEL